MNGRQNRNGGTNRPDQGRTEDSVVDNDAEPVRQAGKQSRNRRQAKPNTTRLAEDSASSHAQPSALPAEQRLIIVGPRHLRDGIRDLLLSHPDFVSPEIVYLDAIAEGVVTVEVAALASSLGTLSPRQLEVARLARQGLSNSEIGALLCIDSTTVKSHLGDVFKKLGLRRRSQLGSILA